MLEKIDDFKEAVIEQRENDKTVTLLIDPKKIDFEDISNFTSPDIYLGIQNYLKTNSSQTAKDLVGDLDFFSLNVYSPLEKIHRSMDQGIVFKLEVPKDLPKEVKEFSTYDLDPFNSFEDHFENGASQFIVKSVLANAVEKFKTLDKNKYTQLSQYKELNNENKKVFDSVYKAYSEKLDFDKHPRLREEFEKRVLDTFLNAQNQTIIKDEAIAQKKKKSPER